MVNKRRSRVPSSPSKQVTPKRSARPKVKHEDDVQTSLLERKHTHNLKTRGRKKPYPRQKELQEHASEFLSNAPHSTYSEEYDPDCDPPREQSPDPPQTIKREKRRIVLLDTDQSVSHIQPQPREERPKLSLSGRKRAPPKTIRSQPPKKKAHTLEELFDPQELGDDVLWQYGEGRNRKTTKHAQEDEHSSDSYRSFSPSKIDLGNNNFSDIMQDSLDLYEDIFGDSASANDNHVDNEDDSECDIDGDISEGGNGGGEGGDDDARILASLQRVETKKEPVSSVAQSRNTPKTAPKKRTSSASSKSKKTVTPSPVEESVAKFKAMPLQPNLHEDYEAQIEILNRTIQILQSEEDNLELSHNAFTSKAIGLANGRLHALTRKTNPTLQNYQELWAMGAEFCEKTRDVLLASKRARQDMKHIKSMVQTLIKINEDLRERYWAETRMLRLNFEDRMWSNPDFGQIHPRSQLLGNIFEYTARDSETHHTRK